MTESATPREQVAHHLERFVEASDVHLGAGGQEKKKALRTKDAIERDLVKAFKLEKKVLAPP